MAYTNDELEKLNPEEKKRKLHDLQMQIIMLDSDNRKVQARKSILEAEIRKIKMDQERARIELERRKQEYDKIEYQIIKNEEDLKRMKKKMNLL